MNYVTTPVERSAGSFFFLNVQSHRQVERRAVLQTPTTRGDPVINSSGGSAGVCSKQLLLYQQLGRIGLHFRSGAASSPTPLPAFSQGPGNIFSFLTASTSRGSKSIESGSAGVAFGRESERLRAQLLTSARQCNGADGISA